MKEKTCDTCAHSYYAAEQTEGFPGRKAQHCSSTAYNAPEYTHDMFMEDLPKGHCRFWTPKKKKGLLS